MRGWVAGLVGVLVAAVVGAVMIVVALTSSSTSIVELEAGVCFDLPIDGEETSINDVDVIDCDQLHNAEVVSVGELNPERNLEYPDDETLFDEVDARCAGVLGAASAEFGLLPVAPNEASWEPLGGRYVCVAVPYGGEPVIGTIASAQQV